MVTKIDQNSNKGYSGHLKEDLPSMDCMEAVVIAR